MISRSRAPGRMRSRLVLLVVLGLLVLTGATAGAAVAGTAQAACVYVNPEKGVDVDTSCISPILRRFNGGG